jgi:NAD(P)H-quinone oxidoreductase subunit 4L
MNTLFGMTFVGAVLLALGLFGVMARRNMMTVLMSVELIFNAATLNFVAFNRYLHPGQPWGQGAALFVIALAAAEAVVGMALVLVIYRNFRTVLTEDLDILKG